MYSSIFAITSADMSGNSAQCLSLQPRQRSKTSEQKVREKNMRIIENSKNLNFVKFSLEQLHKAPKGQDGLKIKLIVYFFWKLTNNLSGSIFLGPLTSPECDGSTGIKLITSTSWNKTSFFFRNLGNNLLPIDFFVFWSITGVRCVDGEWAVTSTGREKFVVFFFEI